ncbi:hypothetical protein [Reyranella soli]|uniref:Glycosyl hydrolase n=1 Tax=Reyranella soli TaxID=1230389 RepID=A0A512N7V8_9HYPH|nr:hypothetical protein [Reyranella soli]GEP54993.1 hypothetical protein RSO01_21590 [Reyranella soli]
MGALALLALSATTVVAQDLPTKAIQPPRSESIDNPPNSGYDPIRKRLLLGIEKQGLFVSPDGGESWTRIDDGSYHAATSIYPAKDRLVVNPDSGDLYSLPRSQGFAPLLYRSDDAGGRWTGLLPDSRSGAKGGNQPVAGESVSPEVHRLLFVPGKPGLAYLQTSFPYMHEEGATLLGDRLWYSPDGLQSFRRLRPVGRYTHPEYFVTAKWLCMTGFTDDKPSHTLACRDHAGGGWRDVAFASVKDRGTIVSVWSDRDGTYLVLAGDALHVSTDALKLFRRIAMPAGDKRLFLDPLAIYPAYLSVKEGEDSYVVYRLGKDHTVTKLGALPAPLLQVDFSRSLGIAAKPGDKRPVFRAELR